MKKNFNILKAAVAVNYLLLLGCTSAPDNTEINGNAVNPSSDTIPLVASNNALVECQLPGQLRKLGRSMTYLAQGRITKMPQSECNIRGGVYPIDKDIVSVK